MASGRLRFRRLTKHTSFLVDPGDASEDGDFVALRQQREKKRDSLRSSKSSLDQIDESPNRGVSQTDVNINQSNFQGQNLTELFRDKLFNFIAEGKDEEIKKCLENNVPINITDLAKDAYRKPNTKENILHVALSHKRIDIARYLIEKLPDTGKDLLLQDFEVTLATAHGVKNVMHLVTELQDLSLAKLVVSKMPSLDKLMKVLLEESPVQIEGQRPRTFPCVHLAAFLGCTDLLVFYLDRGVDVNHLNQKKDTALLWAARWGHIGTVKTLLDRKANPGVENDKGSTALYWAVRYGHTQTVELLLTEGKANPHQTRKLGLVAPIVLASALGYNDIVKILLENGAKVNHVIRGKEMPIHHAAREGHVDVLKTLIENGGDFDKPDERGDTALLLGAKFGHVNIVRTLIHNGANMKQKNLMAEDVWLHAINNSPEFSTSLVEALIDMGLLLSPEKNNNQPIRIGCSKSPLFHAAIIDRCDKIELFLQIKLDPTELDEDGNTFLMVAAQHDKHGVISKFYKLVNIDAQNNKGNTALHTACLKGYHDTINTLIDKKAMANIKNNNGETALHVAAYSKFIRPLTVRKLINHVIKTHAWESLNVPDAEGKNPLHIAAKYATPEILWEFRFVRYKDLDNEKNNAIHDSVRPGHEETFLVMLDIFETMKRDADINQQNGQELSVLHLAASECFGDGVGKLVLLGADLSLQDSNGDTVLHRLTRATVEDTASLEKYLEIFDIVISESVRWWCIKYDLEYADDNKQEFKKYKRKSVLKLTKNIYNNSDLSVLALACSLGAVEIIKRLTQMKDVLYFEIAGEKSKSRRYDVTHWTPLTNNSVTGFFNNTKIIPRPSCLEWLLSTAKFERASYILDLPPVAYIEKSYTSIAAWTYAIIMALHVIYMTLFSYCGVVLQDSLRTGNTTKETEVASTLFYFVSIEPVTILIYMGYELVKHWCLGEQVMKVKLKRGSTNTVEYFINYMGILMRLYAALVLVWMILYAISSPLQTYFLSVSLGLGWLNSIFFTKGFKLIHYFWRMIQNMMVKDVSKFLFVYLFVLLGFSFAFHVVFQVSSKIVEDYSNPIHTMFLMFNLMLGMDEVFTDKFQTEMEIAGYTTVFPKVIYLFYMILGTIILLNLLIAMMNDSYSATLKKQQLLWRIESVQLGIDIQKMLPFTSRMFSKITMHHGHVIPGDNDEEAGWFIEVSSSVSKSELSLGTDKGTELINHLNNRITALDNKLSEQLKSFQNTLQEMNNILQQQSEVTSD